MDHNILQKSIDQLCFDKYRVQFSTHEPCGDLGYVEALKFLCLFFCSSRPCLLMWMCALLPLSLFSLLSSLFSFLFSLFSFLFSLLPTHHHRQTARLSFMCVDAVHLHAVRPSAKRAVFESLFFQTARPPVRFTQPTSGDEHSSSVAIVGISMFAILAMCHTGIHCVRCELF